MRRTTKNDTNQADVKPLKRIRAAMERRKNEVLQYYVRCLTVPEIQKLNGAQSSEPRSLEVINHISSNFVGAAWGPVAKLDIDLSA